MKIITLAISRAAWTRGSPFAAATVLFPTNEEGKYIIQSEGIRLGFTNNGGALTNLWINDTNGNEIDIVMGFDTAADYLKYPGNPYLNGAIGRYAGVISGAQFDLDGLMHNTSANGNNGTMTWNGGDGWGRTILDIGSHTQNSITFVLFDRGWNGFPGTAASCLTHTVTPYEWRIAFGVTPTRARSPINLSQQVFWNLDGFAAKSSKTVAQHRLHLPFSGLRIDTDTASIPTGDLKANKQDSQFDFWSGERLLGEACRNTSVKEPCHGYDETFLVARSQPWKKLLRVHTWGADSAMTAPVGLKLTQGDGEVPLFGAISIEMQDWTDAINNPEWQRDAKTVWGMDGLYTSFSSYKFTVDQR